MTWMLFFFGIAIGLLNGFFGSGGGILAVALLEKKGLVEDWKLFYIQVLCSKYSKTMKPGTYTLSTAMRPRQLMAVLSREDVEFNWGQEEES